MEEGGREGGRKGRVSVSETKHGRRSNEEGDEGGREGGREGKKTITYSHYLP
jgi:hypothetical protein